MFKQLLASLPAFLFPTEPEAQTLLVAINNPPGSTFDVIGRTIVDELDRKHNLHIAVINRPTSEGRIAIQDLYLADDSILISPFTILQFSDMDELRPIAYITSVPFYIVYSKKFHKMEPEDFLSYAKSSNLNCAAIGQRGMTRKMISKYIEKCTFVPYRNAMEALTDVERGFIDVACATPYNAESRGLTRILETKSLIEVGVWASPKMSNDRVVILNRMINDIMANISIQNKMRIRSSGEDFKLISNIEFSEMVEKAKVDYR